MIGLLLEINGHSDCHSMGAPCSGFWNSFLPWLFSLREWDWKRQSNGRFFFFYSPPCQSPHCTFDFQFCLHLFPLSIFPMSFFFLWLFPHLYFLLDLDLVIHKDIKVAGNCQKEEWRDGTNRSSQISLDGVCCLTRNQWKLHFLESGQLSDCGLRSRNCLCQSCVFM